MNNKRRLISVIMITYGHEKYIEEAINGVFKQKTDYDIELIIADDCSPDNTGEVVENLLSKAPVNIRVKYTRHNTNVGMINNFVWALKQAKGSYIAICEGDDYWTDPLKLQKQVLFLESHTDYVLTFTRRDILKDSILESSSSMYEKSTFDKNEIPHLKVPTLTVMFRNLIDDIPSQMSEEIIDASLFLFLSQYGAFYYFDENTAVYRVHQGGAWSGSSEIMKYTRSVNVRLAAWKHLQNINKVELARVLVTWLRWKKDAELRKRKYFAALSSICLEFYFTFYIRKNALRTKFPTKNP